MSVDISNDKYDLSIRKCFENLFRIVSSHIYPYNKIVYTFLIRMVLKKKKKVGTFHNYSTHYATIYVILVCVRDWYE